MLLDCLIFLPAATAIYALPSPVRCRRYLSRSLDSAARLAMILEIPEDHGKANQEAKAPRPCRKEEAMHRLIFWLIGLAAMLGPILLSS